MILIFILLLIFPLELKTNAICSSNEYTLVSDSHFRLKEGNKFELVEQFNPFTQIKLMNYELQDYNLTLITRTQSYDRLLFVFQNKNLIHIRICILQFSIYQDTIKSQNFLINEEISIQPMGIFLNIYYFQNFLYIIYQEFQDPNQYLIQIMNHTTNIVLDYIKIRKQKDCIYNMEENSFNYLYFAQYNCIDWVVQIFSVNPFELQKTIRFDDFKQILRQIYFLQLSQILSFLFDNYVYYYKPQIDYFEVAFEYQDGNILLHEVYFQILNTTQIEKDNFIKNVGIMRKVRPKKMLKLNKDLLFLYDEHIELFKNNYISFDFPIQLDDFFIFLSTYPYFYGVRKNKLILIRSNYMNPLFKCSENKSFQATFYRDYNQKYIDWTFTTKMIEIKSEQILYFNINQTLYQLTIPTLIQEIQEYSSEFEIIFNKFILGGPFHILNAKSDQNTIVTYESMLSQFCKFQDFSKFLWWVVLFSNKNEQVLLVQDDNLILHLINCDLLIQKNLLKIGRISQKQINQKNNLLLMQNNNKSLFLFEIKENFKYKIDQITFNKEIRFIQPMFLYFYVFLNDWECYLVQSMTLNTTITIEKQPSIKSALLGSEIILCKKISTNNDIIGTKSEILLQNHNFNHLIQIMDVYDIIKVKQHLYEFIIIHKSKRQDIIKITLQKYYLNNFQFINMFELPKSNQSFEYIWPICINENGQYLTIAAKDSLTNNTFVLIYEISQPYSTILRDIIQVDCCECSQLLKSGVIVYQFQNLIFQSKINFVKFKVKFDNNQTQIKFNNISFTLKSKINQEVQEGFQFQIISLHHIEGLQQKNNGNLILNDHYPYVFDPRKLILGSLQNITSSSVIITPALKLIDQTIISGESVNYLTFPLFIYSKIIQEIEGRIFDILDLKKTTENSNRISVLLEKNGQYTFIIKGTKGHMDIKVFDLNYHFKYQFTIQNYLCDDIGSIIKIDNFQFIICTKTILLYVMNTNQPQYLNQITNSFMECTIEKINNKKQIYLAYDKKSAEQNCILIEILETNQINTFSFIIDIETKFNILSEQFNSILLTNLQIYENNYLNMTGFYFKQKKNAYLFQLTIDIYLNQTTNVIPNGIIKYPKNTEIKKLLYLNQFLVILFNYKILQYGQILVLYDLHEKEQFEIFESIQSIESEILEIAYHNDSYFYLIEINKNYTVFLYQTSQYLFEFPKQKEQEYQIKLYNQIDSIEMIIKISNLYDQYLNLTIELLFINLLSILLLLNRKRNKK